DDTNVDRDRADNAGSLRVPLLPERRVHQGRDEPDGDSTVGPGVWGFFEPGWRSVCSRSLNQREKNRNPFTASSTTMRTAARLGTPVKPGSRASQNYRSWIGFGVPKGIASYVRTRTRRCVRTAAQRGGTEGGGNDSWVGPPGRPVRPNSRLRGMVA